MKPKYATNAKKPMQIHQKCNQCKETNANKPKMQPKMQPMQTNQNMQPMPGGGRAETNHPLTGWPPMREMLHSSLSSKPLHTDDDT